MVDIEFALFAPYNEAVSLLGSFTDDAVPMEKGDDGYFRTRIPLADGLYHYRFRVQSKSWFLPENEWIEITDPYATDIDVGSQNGILNIKDGRRIVDDYVWQHDDHLLPPDHSLVIYELHVGDFSGGEADPFTRGKYTDITAKLDYLAELGINAIELMPVKEFPGDRSWGYNPRYFFAPESSYGATFDLKRLIDECHGRGIRVIMDGVYNHSENSAPLALIDHDYWYYHEPKEPELSWGPQFNYSHYDEHLDIKPVWKFIGDVVRFWIEEYHIDGIRYDAARQIGDFDFMRWIVERTSEVAGAKPFYNIAEFLPPEPGVIGAEGPMDGCWHDFFLHTVVPFLCTGEVELERLKDVLDARRTGFAGAASVINYLSNHDHNHLMADLAEHGVHDDDAFRRARLGAALVTTAMGVPMIWMGEEFGECKTKTTDQNKIDWQLLANEANRGLPDYYRRLVALRRQRPALQTDNITFFHENQEEQVLGYVRWNDEGARVVVLVNLSGRHLEGYRIESIPENGVWHEWTTNRDVEVNDGVLVYDLPEYEARIFVQG
jgi:1,4-alpha-glucan branching enzyme